MRTGGFRIFLVNFVSLRDFGGDFDYELQQLDKTGTLSAGAGAGTGNTQPALQVPVPVPG